MNWKEITFRDVFTSVIAVIITSSLIGIFINTRDTKLHVVQYESRTNEKFIQNEAAHNDIKLAVKRNEDKIYNLKDNLDSYREENNVRLIKLELNAERDGTIISNGNND